MLRSNCFLILHIFWILVVLTGCSDKRISGGNSSETGSPEIVGRLILSNGSPASYARITCVPKQFNPAQDSILAEMNTIADSMGNFTISYHGTKGCNLEAKTPTNEEQLYVNGLFGSTTSTQAYIGILQPPGSLRVGVQGLADGDGVIVFIPGASYTRKLIVQFSSVLLDSVASGLYDSICILASDSTLLSTSAFIAPGQRTNIEVKALHYTLRVELPTDSKGAALTDTLYGFPLAIRLDTSRLDFRYINSTTPLHVYMGDRNKSLNYHVSRWDPSLGFAEIWVRLDTLLPENAQQYLSLVWDESKSALPDTTALPFAMQDGFLAGWHFDEGTDKFLDVGEYGFDGRPNKISVAGGVVGKGLFFNGSTSYISIPGSALGPLDFGDTSTYTIFTWVKLEDAGTSRFIWCKGYYQYQFLFKQPDSWMLDYIDEKSSGYRVESSITADTANDFKNWVLLTVSYDKGTVSIFRNGVLESKKTSNNGSTDLRFTGSTFEIGRRLMPDGYMDRVFSGALDEMSISGVVRSPEWIRLTYLNQKSTDFWPPN